MVDVGPLDDVLASVAAGGGFRYVPEARAHLVEYPPEAPVPRCGLQPGRRTGRWPRTGLDRFAVTVEEGHVMIDTSETLEGAPLGTRTVDDEPDGAPCLPLDS